jgi:hypothetical protein
MVILSLFAGVQRSFLVDAKTSFIRVTFVGQNAWRLPVATICRPREILNRDAVSEEYSACSDLFQIAEQTRNLVLPFPNQFTLMIRAESHPFGTQVRMIFPDSLGSDFPAGTEIVVGASDWTKTGALLFSGNAVLGNVLGSGERHYLHFAGWEARQTSWSSWLRGGTTEIVMSGSAMRGAQISVAKLSGPWYTLKKETLPAIVYGQITPTSILDNLPAFAANFVSEPGKTELHLSYYGLANIAKIRPDFIATLASSEIVLLLIAILPLLAALKQLMLDLILGLRRKKQLINEVSDQRGIERGLD